MTEPGPYETLEKADRIKAFLAEPIVAEALQEMERTAHQRFLAARTDEELRLAQADARSIADFSARMTGIMGDGERARAEIQANEKKASRAPAAR
jgi:hypothetical protein